MELAGARNRILSCKEKNGFLRCSQSLNLKRMQSFRVQLRWHSSWEQVQPARGKVTAFIWFWHEGVVQIVIYPEHCSQLNKKAKFKPSTCGSKSQGIFCEFIDRAVMRYKTVFRVKVGSILIVANWYIIDPSSNVLVKRVLLSKGNY